MNSDFVRKLKSGILPSEADWLDHLRSVHDATPSFTPTAFADLRSRDGRNSYAILAETMDSPSARVLDLACGDGHLAPYVLSRLGPEGRYTGLDMSEGELCVARANMSDRRAEFRLGRAQALPFMNHEFDTVVCHLALMLMTPLEPVIAEVARVLKPGGQLVAILSAAPDDDFLLSVQHLCAKFIDSRLPHRARAQTGDARLASLTGLKSLFHSDLDFAEPAPPTDLHFEITTNPEGVWRLINGMYMTGLLENEDRCELKRQIIQHAETYARFGRHLRFEFPMKRLTVCKQ